MPPVLHKGLKISVIIGIIAIVVGLFLPNFAAVREKARRVEDLENLNAIWKIISSWGLTPSNSGVPLSLDQLVKNKIITADMLINHETGKPIEYYPGPYSNGNDVVLVSRGKHGMNVIKVAGQGMWVDNGTPRDEQRAQVKGPETIASEVVIPQFKVNEASLDAIVKQINQAIGKNEHAAGQLSIKLNPSINQGIKITLTLEGVTVLSILQYLKEITGTPYIARGRDIWIGAPVVPAKDITEQELTELRKKLRRLSTEALVDLFTETKYQGLASHSTASASGFAALEIEPQFNEGVLGSATPIVSPVMQEIVTRGVVALPMLIEHLRDDRATSVIVGADGFHTSKWRSDEYDARYRGSADLEVA